MLHESHEIVCCPNPESRQWDYVSVTPLPVGLQRNALATAGDPGLGSCLPLYAIYPLPEEMSPRFTKPAGPCDGPADRYNDSFILGPQGFHTPIPRL